jgi:hypothetical protein
MVALMTKNIHAVALGRLGGAATKGITSPKKARASKRNGKKGGWWAWHEKPTTSKADRATRLRGVRVHARIEADNHPGQNLKTRTDSSNLQKPQ